MLLIPDPSLHPDTEFDQSPRDVRQMTSHFHRYFWIMSNVTQADLGWWSATRLLYLLPPPTLSSTQVTQVPAAPSTRDPHCFQSTSLPSQGSEPSNY